MDDMKKGHHGSIQKETTKGIFTHPIYKIVKSSMTKAVLLIMYTQIYFDSLFPMINNYFQAFEKNTAPMESIYQRWL